MSGHQMSGHRQAAAALYSLARGDQTRILAELSADDRRILEDYLAELAALGFDKAADMAEAAAPGPVAPTAASRLHGATVAEVLAVVAHEPAVLIAQLLMADNWPWAQELLDMLAPPRRTAVRKALDSGVGAAPARACFVVAAVSAGLSPLAAAPAPPAAGGRRWFPWAR
jgi:hypothetical protein